MWILICGLLGLCCGLLACGCFGFGVGLSFGCLLFNSVGHDVITHLCLLVLFVLIVVDVIVIYFVYIGLAADFVFTSVFVCLVL